MQIIYFQVKDFYVPFVTLQSIGFIFFAKIMKGSCVFVVQVVLVLTLQATLSHLTSHEATRIPSLLY